MRKNDLHRRKNRKLEIKKIIENHYFYYFSVFFKGGPFNNGRWRFQSVEIPGMSRRANLWSRAPAVATRGPLLGGL